MTPQALAPYIGLIVLFNVKAPTTQSTHAPGTQFPAIVESVGTNGTCNLCVLNKGRTDYEQNVKMGAGAGEWSFITGATQGASNPGALQTQAAGGANAGNLSRP